MTFRIQTRRTAAAVAAVALLLQPLQPLFAANNTNSGIANGNVVNLTANVDWDYDAAAPVQIFGTIPVTKQVLRDQILRETARSVFLMTEGRHRVGTVFVYKNEGRDEETFLYFVLHDFRSALKKGMS